MMKQLYFGRFDSDRHWAWLAELGARAGGSECWTGQKNGLIGTSLANQISFTFGPHTSEINIRIVACDYPPVLDDIWEEVVESPFMIDKSVALCLLDSNGDPYGNPIHLEVGNYRVRFCAINFGVTEDVDKLISETELAALASSEQYELAFWREPTRPDEIIRAKSPHACSWHKFRQEDELRR